jgi:hypothetical protein
VVLVAPHPGPVFDEVAHPARGPQPRGQSKRFGTTFSIHRTANATKSRRTPAGFPLHYALAKSRAFVTMLRRTQ